MIKREDIHFKTRVLPDGRDLEIVAFLQAEVRQVISRLVLDNSRVSPVDLILRCKERMIREIEYQFYNEVSHELQKFRARVYRISAAGIPDYKKMNAIDKELARIQNLMRVSDYRDSSNMEGPDYD